MKKLTFSLVILFSLCITVAFAQTKTFQNYSDEYQTLLDGFVEANQIYEACQGCIDAFNADDSDMLNENYSIIVKAGLMPQNYKLKDMSLIEPLRDTYETLKEMYQNDIEKNLAYQSYWLANSMAKERIMKQCLAGEANTFPTLNSTKYSPDVIVDLPDDFFDEATDISKYCGDIFLIKASIFEYHPDEYCWFLRYNSEAAGTRIIAVLNPIQFSSSINYLNPDDVPPMEEESYFYVTFFLMRNEDRLKIFYFGADDEILDSLRLLASPTDPLID